jgi:orf22
MSEHWSNNDRGYRLKMWLDLVDQNIVENYSNYRIRVFLVSGGWSFAEYNCTGFIDFDGGRRYGFSIGNLGAGQTQQLLDETYKVWHNNDGTKRFGIMAQLNGQGGYSPNTLVINGFDVEVPAIARASTSDGFEAYFGQQVTINIDKRNDAFRHKVLYKFGVKSGVIGENVDTSVTWTVPTSLTSELGTDKKHKGTLVIETYSGSTKIGQVEYGIVLKINDTNGDVKPTFQSITLTETNQTVRNVMGSNTTFLQILSNIQCTFVGAVGSFGVGIKRYHAEIVGKNISIDDNNGRFGVMNFTGDLTISAYVVDERGLKSDVKSVNIRVLPYFSPTIFFTADRVGQNASQIKLSTTYKVANLKVDDVQKNSVSVKFSTSEDGGKTFVLNEGSNSNFGSNQTVEEVNRIGILTGDFSPKNTYTIRATISDKLSPPVSYDVPVSTEQVVVEYDRNGVGIGKVRTKYKVEVAPGDVSIDDGVYRIKDKEIQNHQLTEKNGTCLKVNSGDANNLLKTGFYNVNDCANMPNNDRQWWYLTVISNADTYVMQQANSFFNDKIYTRQKRGNQWTNWVALQQEVKPVEPKFPDTEWSKSNGKMTWRVSARVLYISINFTAENEGTIVGGFPAKYLEHYPDSLMLSGVDFSLEERRNLLFQVNLDGTIHVLNTVKGRSIRTVVTIPI